MTIAVTTISKEVYHDLILSGQISLLKGVATKYYVYVKSGEYHVSMSIPDYKIREGYSCCGCLTRKHYLLVKNLANENDSNNAEE